MIKLWNNVDVYRCMCKYNNDFLILVFYECVKELIIIDW